MQEREQNDSTPNSICTAEQPATVTWNDMNNESVQPSAVFAAYTQNTVTYVYHHVKTNVFSPRALLLIAEWNNMYHQVKTEMFSS